MLQIVSNKSRRLPLGIFKPRKQHFLSHFFLRLATTLATSALIFSCLTACPPTPSQIIGDILDKFQTAAKATLDRAAADADIVLGNAAAQDLLVVQNLESRFARDLNAAIDSVDSTERDTFRKLDGLVTEIGSTVEAVVLQGTKAALLLGNAAGITNHNPQVLEYKPRSIAVKLEDSTPFTLSIEGDFPDAATPGFAPQLELGGKTYQIKHDATGSQGASDTFHLEFDIPKSALPAKINSVQGASMALKVNYKEKGKHSDSIQTSDFILRTWVMPLHPLKALTLENHGTTTSTVHSTFVWPTDYPSTGDVYRVQSWSTCKHRELNDTGHEGQGVPTVIRPQPTEAGQQPWQIDSANWRYVDTRHTSRTSVSVTNVNILQASVMASSDPDCILGVSFDSGDAKFVVDVQEHHDVTLPNDSFCNLLTGSTIRRPARPVEDPDDPYTGGGPIIIPPVNTVAADCGAESVDWGSSVSLSVAKGHWKLHAVMWDGRVLDFPSTQANQDKYLKVEDEGNAVNISLVPAAS